MPARCSLLQSFCISILLVMNRSASQNLCVSPLLDQRLSPSLKHKIKVASNDGYLCINCQLAVHNQEQKAKIYRGKTNLTVALVQKLKSELKRSKQDYHALESQLKTIKRNKKNLQLQQLLIERKQLLIQNSRLLKVSLSQTAEITHLKKNTQEITLKLREFEERQRQYCEVKERFGKMEEQLVRQQAQLKKRLSQEVIRKNRVVNDFQFLKFNHKKLQEQLIEEVKIKQKILCLSPNKATPIAPVYEFGRILVLRLKYFGLNKSLFFQLIDSRSAVDLNKKQVAIFLYNKPTLVRFEPSMDMMLDYIFQKRSTISKHMFLERFMTLLQPFQEPSFSHDALRSAIAKIRRRRRQLLSELGRRSSSRFQGCVQVQRLHESLQECGVRGQEEQSVLVLISVQSQSYRDLNYGCLQRNSEIQPDQF